MGKIEILSEQVSNKIAAGEVVERPASVVKELVENSIDAGSDRIKIQVEAGGKKLIQIIDNGSGMEKDDAQLAFERHATSKISQPNDLFSLRTLGFRGEALASIAAISRLELKTKTADSLEGFKIKLAGGEIKEKKSCGCVKGTNIIVKDLFFNTPVRYKYLKQDSTEMRHITRIITRLALAYPEISFSLRHNGKVSFETSGNGRLIDVIYNLYGADIAKNMIKLNYEADYMKLQGYISRPNLTRSSKKHQSFFVNGRYIRSNLISKAVIEAYKSLVKVNNYPIVILKLKLNPILVDVNIHPTKLQAKFSRKGQVFDFVKAGVKEILNESSLTPEYKFKKESKTREDKPDKKTKKDSNYSFNFNQSRQNKRREKPNKRKEKIEKLYQIKPAQKKREQEVKQADDCQEDNANYDPADNNLRAVGQVNNSYILAESKDGLFIIDQHAAHEQIIYQKLMGKAKKDQIQIQNLLVPLRFNLAPTESELMAEKEDKLKSLGFEIESFGNNEYIIQGVPTLLEDLDDKNQLLNLIEEVLTDTKNKPEDFIDRLLIQISCKAAIKAGDSLAMPEIKRLLADINQYDISNCPHGRPVIINLNWKELEKKFKRR